MEVKRTAEKNQVSSLGFNEEKNPEIIEWRTKDFQTGDLKDLVDHINSDEKFKQLYGVIGLRKLISTGNIIFEYNLTFSIDFDASTQNVRNIIDSGIVPKLIKLLEMDDEPEIQVDIWDL